jgi:hypothetical protein
MKIPVHNNHNRAEEVITTLWKSFKTIAELLWTSEDDGRTWGNFIPLIPERL